jgi:transposase, IS6 family
VIVLAVRWYLRFGLSYRDVEELLAERGIDVDHVSVHRWVRRFAPLLADAARFGRHRVGDRWFVDETYVKVAGRWVYLYRAVDQYGQVIDVYASSRRDREAARRFFQRAGTTTGVAPFEVVTHRAPTYLRILERPLVTHTPSSTRTTTMGTAAIRSRDGTRVGERGSASVIRWRTVMACLTSGPVDLLRSTARPGRAIAADRLRRSYGAITAAARARAA